MHTLHSIRRLFASTNLCIRLAGVLWAMSFTGAFAAEPEPATKTELWFGIRRVDPPKPKTPAPKDATEQEIQQTKATMELAPEPPLPEPRILPLSFMVGDDKASSDNVDLQKKVDGLSDKLQVLREQLANVQSEQDAQRIRAEIREEVRRQQPETPRTNIEPRTPAVVISGQSDLGSVLLIAGVLVSFVMLAAIVVGFVLLRRLRADTSSGNADSKKATAGDAEPVSVTSYRVSSEERVPERFDLGPTFEEERIEREKAEQQKEQAMLLHIFEQNVSLQEKLGQS